MTMTIVKGIVIRERQSGDADKFLDILTDKCGLIEVMARGVKRINSKSSSASQLFAYSQFCLSQRRNRYYIDSAEPIKIFYPLREDLVKLSLVSYFSEVISYSSFPDESRNEDILRLLLNTLHYLSEGERQPELLKSIFEFRFMADTGHMPDIVGCCVCGNYIEKQMLFSIQNGKLFCKDCFSGYRDNDVVCINESVLHAIRHIVLTDFDKLFNFKLVGDSMKLLSLISESYLRAHVGRNFKTLDFYKSLI